MVIHAHAQFRVVFYFCGSVNVLHLGSVVYLKWRVFWHSDVVFFVFGGHWEGFFVFARPCATFCIISLPSSSWRWAPLLIYTFFEQSFTYILWFVVTNLFIDKMAWFFVVYFDHFDLFYFVISLIARLQLLSQYTCRQL